MMEAGVPDYEVITFNGIVAPAATPAAIVSKLNSALNEGLSTAVQSRTPRGYSVLDYLIAKYGYERAFAE
jgi:tripartite-type tricarboxylate transporter receptor subunit TctC